MRALLAYSLAEALSSLRRGWRASLLALLTTTAAVFVEPVPGEGGVCVAPPAFGAAMSVTSPAVASTSVPTGTAANVFNGVNAFWPGSLSRTPLPSAAATTSVRPYTGVGRAGSTITFWDSGGGAGTAGPIRA